jgi:hypothetical protein
MMAIDCLRQLARIIGHALVAGFAAAAIVIGMLFPPHPATRYHDQPHAPVVSELSAVTTDIDGDHDDDDSKRSR